MPRVKLQAADEGGQLLIFPPEIVERLKLSAGDDLVFHLNAAAGSVMLFRPWSQMAGAVVPRGEGAD